MRFKSVSKLVYGALGRPIPLKDTAKIAYYELDPSDKIDSKYSLESYKLVTYTFPNDKSARV